MTTKTIKTVLFASLIAAIALPFSLMNFADAVNNDTNDNIKQTTGKLYVKDSYEELILKLQK